MEDPTTGGSGLAKPLPGRLALTGTHIRLEPLSLDHAEALSAAACTRDRSLYQWTVVPLGLEETTSYVQTALEWRDAGTAVPFAVIRNSDNAVIGTTRYWNIERWDWPAGHARHNNPHPDVCEIGYTWYAPSAIRTGANAESKFLMLAHAFEVWNALRVSLQTDARNLRSQAAIERLGCKREGVLRAQKLAPDVTARDSVRYSMIAAEWPDAKQRLMERFRERLRP
jgi:N-acetyltransferase